MRTVNITLGSWDAGFCYHNEATEMISYPTLYKNIH